MIRVMVVEDEAPILRSICERIKEAHDGFSVEAVAYNGREAIDLLEKIEIDVMFVDMNLPVLSGIDVLTYIKDKQLDIIPVVLSGYKDFEYVKRAFENDVIDYLLKPLKEDELHSILLRIEEKYKGLQREKNIQVFEQVLKGGGTADTYEDKGYHMILVTAGNYHMSPGLDGNICHEILNKERLERVLSQQFGEDMFWCVDGGSIMDKAAFVKNADLLNLNCLNHVLNEFTGSSLPVTITVNRSVIFVNEIYTVYYQMKKFAEQNMLFGKSSLLIYHGEMMRDSSGKTEHEKADVAVMRCKSRQQPAAICEIFENLLEETLKRPVRQAVLNQMIKRFWAGLCNAQPGSREYVELEDDINFILNHNFNKEGLLKEFRFLIFQCFGSWAEEAGDKKELASRIKEYLDTNYGQDITNQSVSDKFGLVSSYLSSIFKEYYEVSMGDYLIKRRIEAAKQLLDEQDLKIKDIAVQVGYNDPLYFSKAFRKSTGMSPREYKKDGNRS